MRKNNFIWLIVIICGAFLFFSCSKKIPTKNIVAKVNNYYMTKDDLRNKIRHSPYSAQNAEDLEQILDLAIREQVLIQEAQRQGLDREKTFMKTIERYWSQTLIKELLDKQTRKIYEGVSKDKREEAFKAWMDELYKNADIKIYNKVLGGIKAE